MRSRICCTPGAGTWFTPLPVSFTSFPYNNSLIHGGTWCFWFDYGRGVGGSGIGPAALPVVHLLQHKLY